MTHAPSASTLGKRWDSFAIRFSGDDPGVFGALACLYEFPPRAYHHLGHVADCLDALRMLAKIPPPTAEYAIWFHDAVYVAGASNNEHASAALAEAYGVALGLNASFLNDACAAILATRCHTDPPSEAAAMVIDADLSILASDVATYKAYTAAIRAEWPHISDDTFREGRAAFLAAFLERPKIYSTERGRVLWEAPARENMTLEHAVLTGAR